MKTQTGNWKDSDSLLALYRFHANAEDHELEEMNIERQNVLDLIQALEADMSGYRETELLTIARQMIRAYNIGVGEALK